MQGKTIRPQDCRMYNQTPALVYTSGQSIPVVRGCFAFMVTNVGDTDANLNGMIIHASATPATDLGDSRTISGHEGDLYMGNLNLAFVPPLGAQPAVELVQLYYITQDQL